MVIWERLRFTLDAPQNADKPTELKHVVKFTTIILLKLCQLLSEIESALFLNSILKLIFILNNYYLF